MRKAEYKPLLLTTTMRNPERLKNFLNILKEYDGEVLNSACINFIVQKILKKGLYCPTKNTKEIEYKWNNETDLDEADIYYLIINNPQNHKEAGFEKGWQSRFDTWYKIAKELGFVYYELNNKIEFSTTGNMLLENNKPENEILVFANAFAKYYRNNPFRKILNNNIPLLLLIRTINLLNQSSFNTAGISTKELPLLLCWQDSNYEKLAEAIIDIRRMYGFTPSDEVILEKCYSLISLTKRDDKSILIDYPDDFIRKMRLTGLISLRGNGRFIDINKNEKKAIEYLLKTNLTYPLHSTQKEFFTYMGQIDKFLINNFSIYTGKTSKINLNKWVDYYSWDKIKLELLNLSYKKSSKDEILKIIEQPLRLEFLTSLALLKKLTNISVKPNLICDDEGLPISFASGNKPDIECLENDRNILVEVTLLTGSQQHIRESYSITRHLQDFLQKNTNSFTLFISPKVFKDTCSHAEFMKYKDNIDIKILDIDLFIAQLEIYKNLYDISYSKTSCQISSFSPV